MYGIIIEMKQKYFIQQTHFVGVLLPKDLEETLENCRKYMNRTYGCKSGYGKLRDETLKGIFTACPGCTRKDKRVFQPHATVANRDIPQGAIPDALKVLNELNLIKSFPVNNITIFERKGSRWEAAVILEL